MSPSTILNEFKKLSTILQAIRSFFLVYVSLFVFSVPIFLIIIYRTLLSVVFKTVYKGKYEIMGSMDAPTATNTYANIFTITFFMQVRGECDIDKLRQRLSTNLRRKDNNGRMPYGRFLKAAVQKFGFSCWEDKSDSIDFSHHVKLLPGAGEENRIYTENEVFDTVADSVNNEWDEDKPRWEVLVTPKVKLDGEDKNLNDDGEICSVICVNILHIYVDGVSFVQVLRNCFLDQPPPKFIFDPVNPPIPPVPLCKKLLLCMQVFFLGPYISLRLMGRDDDPVFYEGPLTGQKMIGRTTMEISLEMMRRIRKKFKCSTQAIFHSAFTSALQTMSSKKGCKIPKEVLGGIVSGWFPYPDEYPRNNAIVFYEPMQFGITDQGKRLAAMEDVIQTLNGRESAMISFIILFRTIGMCPTFIINSTMGGLRGTYFVSNVPGVETFGELIGNVVENVFGIAPLINGMRFGAGVGCYNKRFTVGFEFEKSKVIGSRNEADLFIQEFENEIKSLDAQA